VVRILAFAGSTRAGSFNKKLVRIAAAGARAAGAEVTVLDLADCPLPLYDGDLEARAGLPDGAARLRRLIADHAGLLISTPEYNGSVPGVLKNAIDWASRPVPGEPPLVCFAGKAAALVSASPGALGGARALAHLRQILNVVKVLVIPEQRSVAGARDAFDAAGDLKDPALRAAVAGVGARLADLLARLDG